MSASVRLEVVVDLRSSSTMERGHHEVRALPSTTPEQRPQRTSLLVEPAAWSASHLDHWGTRVHALEVGAPHDRLTVTTTSVVEVDRASAPLPGGSWEDVHAAARGAGAEHLAPHPQVPALEDLVGTARTMLFDGATPDDVGLALCSLVGSRVAWDDAADLSPARPAATATATAAARAWRDGVGDADDLTHLALAALRAVGIPARAVVGFVHPARSAEAVVLGQAASTGRHAWVEWFSGAWFAFDVARGRAAGDLHVAVGHGRAVSDVPVLRGATGFAQPTQPAGPLDPGAPARPTPPGGAAARVTVTAALTRLA